MPESARNVVSQTVARDLCVGCGVCVGVCPQDNLRLGWNIWGEYEPADSGKCRTGCDLCLAVCPFQDHEENEDVIAGRLFGNQPEIEHDGQLGYFIGSWVGHVERGDYRSAGASGGVATWFLEKLLRSNVVDRVICVTPTPHSDQLFRFACFEDSEGVRRSSKSAYYPIEMSEVLREVLRTGARYACIGLPCFIKALRLAEQRVPRIGKRIILHAGLVCGQLKTRHFAEILARRAGLNAQSLNFVSFREKTLGGPASELVFAAADGQETARLAWSRGYGECWTTGQLKIRACCFCDDIFAELADVVFMDAWLPEFVGDGRGTSIVTARSALAASILEDGLRSGDLAMRPINAAEVLASQADVVYEKRRALAWRLWLADQLGQPRPKKRVSACKPDPLRLRLLQLQETIRVASREAAAAQQAMSPTGLDFYDKVMGSHLRRLRNLTLLLKWAARASRITRAVRKALSQLLKPVSGKTD